jgi:hypothetical protein
MLQFRPSEQLKAQLSAVPQEGLVQEPPMLEHSSAPVASTTVHTPQRQSFLALANVIGNNNKKIMPNRNKLTFLILFKKSHLCLLSIKFLK